jgi:hypothetical protein
MRLDWHLAGDEQMRTPRLHFLTGSTIDANPISYLSARKQRVAAVAGSAIIAFALEE